MLALGQGPKHLDLQKSYRGMPHQTLRTMGRRDVGASVYFLTRHSFYARNLTHHTSDICLIAISVIERFWSR